MASSSSSGPDSPPPPPDRAALREAALAHLARFGTTRHGLEQVLARRVSRWERAALKAGAEADEVSAAVAALKPVIQAVAADMVQLGAVNDEAFARARAKKLVRSGRSGKAVQAHLAARGVEADVRNVALQDVVEGFSPQETELSAALVLARKRRLGPFAGRPSLRNSSYEEEEGQDERQKAMAERQRALGVLARSGYGRDVAERVLDMEPEEAGRWMERLRSES
ncbi:regulatory protein RecX [Acetobacter senegalensis]|uniref:RecX family transcriptional regulator n=1 Tax=Acetobacter senegalensis TaxID=446692 RepID=UPI00264FF61F|nr:RecX family transcriptional regulator [Acetobacter senegalensis]MDN7352709.1 RecX family transcriptional regulator [Acetobacter senegalensis]